MKFGDGTVNLASGCDNIEGTFNISVDHRDFDLVIIGGGLSGLSTAFHVLLEQPQARTLILEANNFIGGNAACDGPPGLPIIASSAGALLGKPDVSYIADLYSEIGLDLSKYAIEPGSDRFFLDETTPGVRNGFGGWYGDLFNNPEKFTQRPFSPKVFDGLIRCTNAWKEWYNTTGGPTDPPDESATDYDYLSESTLYEYITRDLKCDPLVAKLYSAYTIDCMGGTADIVNAHTAISFLASEYAGEPDSIFAPPGGTWFLAARLNDWLRNSGVGVTARQPVDVKLGAVALRVDERSSAKGSNVNTIYYNGAGFSSVTSRAAVVATPPSSSRHLVGHLFDPERQAAWGEFNTCPAVVANVAIRSMKPFVELGLGYANHMWGSKYWANFVIADWSNGNRFDDNRASVLTFYSATTVSPSGFPAERMKLLYTPFSDYEDSLRSDLSRVMRGTSFDFDRDVSAIFVYRWGHGLITPTPRSVFGSVRGSDGRLDRSKATRQLACQPIGAISFSGQYREGAPSAESAIGSGRRAAREVLARLSAR